MDYNLISFDLDSWRLRLLMFTISSVFLLVKLLGSLTCKTPWIFDFLYLDISESHLSFIEDFKFWLFPCFRALTYILSSLRLSYSRITNLTILTSWFWMSCESQNVIFLCLWVPSLISFDFDVRRLQHLTLVKPSNPFNL